MKQWIEEETDLRVAGYLPQDSALSWDSRHLGLLQPEELKDLDGQLDRLADLMEETIDTEVLLSIAGVEGRRVPEERTSETKAAEKQMPEEDGPVIAVARDEAFCFIYQENIDLLEKMGCTVRFFSPLSDSSVPDADGLILCGGYPELWAERLSANRSMLESVKKCVESGMPTIAECGGFMYLHDELTDKSGISYPMAGVLGGRAFPTDRLQRFGYITMTAKRDSLLCRSGERIRAHEFHYWDSTSCGEDFTAEKADGRTWKCCHARETLYAGFPHINFYSDIKLAENFVRKCISFGENNG